MRPSQQVFDAEASVAWHATFVVEEIALVEFAEV